MSKRPTGFKSQEDYNAYMRNYKAKRRAETKTLKSAKYEANLLLSHAKLSTEDQQKVKELIDSEKYFEARNLILFLLNQTRERNQFETSQKKQELLNKYLCSDPEYLKMSQEGQHYWDQIFRAYLDVLIRIVTQSFLVKEEDSEHYANLRINIRGCKEELESELLKELVSWFAAQRNEAPVKTKHPPKLPLPQILIEEDKKKQTEANRHATTNQPETASLHNEKEKVNQ